MHGIGVICLTVPLMYRLLAAAEVHTTQILVMRNREKLSTGILTSLV